MYTQLYDNNNHQLPNSTEDNGAMALVYWEVYWEEIMCLGM